MTEARQDVISEGDAYRGGVPDGDRPSLSKVRARLEKLVESDNIAEDLDDTELGRIGQRVVKEYEVDLASRADWEDRNEKAMELALQVTEDKNWPWPKASNIKFPLITTASIQFAARAYPAIVEGKSIVKGKVVGSDDGVPNPEAQQQAMQQAQMGAQGQPGAQQPQMGPPQGQPSPAQGAQQPGPQQPAPQQWLVEPGAKRLRADRVARHMSYQLTDEMEEWEEDTDRLLHVLPIVGCCFRKTWYDPALARNRSELVLAKDFVVNYHAESLLTVPRQTQRFELYPFEITERERMGLYREITYSPTGEAGDDDAPHEFLEQHRFLDLDEDGYPEPYIVTVHKDSSQVVRIVARFEPANVEVDEDEGRIAKITADQYFTKYGFIPSPDGGFYDMGFGLLLKPLNDAVNSTLNQMVDAGTLQNTGGGFIGAGLRIKGGDTRFRPGEYKRVEATGGTIRDNVLPLDHPGPSSVLFNLLGLLIEAGRDISSVKDVMTGDEGPQNEAAARTMARIEQGMKVFTAIYRRIFRALKQELKKLYRLNSLYLAQDAYFTFHDDPEAISREDYRTGDLDIQPVADPSAVMDQQKMARAEFMMQFLSDPMVEPREARKRIFEAAGIPEVDEILLEQPPPNPEIAAQADEIEIKKRDLEIKAADGRAQQIKDVSQAYYNLARAESEQARVQVEALQTLMDELMNEQKLAVEREKVTRQQESERERNDVQREANRGRIQGMAGASGNGGGS